MKKIITFFVLTFSILKLSYGQFDLIDRLLSRGVQISMVSVDPDSWKNMIVWQRYDIAKIMVDYPYFSSFTVDNYYIHRWDSISNVYNMIATIPVTSLPVWVDPSSQPGKISYKYKITASMSYKLTALPLVNHTFTSFKDSSRYHQTITVRKEIKNDTLKLRIKPYKIERYDITKAVKDLKIKIYRNTDSAKLFSKVYDSVTYNINDTVFQYTDPDKNQKDSLYYYVGAVDLSTPLDPSQYISFKASTGPFSQSVSNLEDNRLKTTEENKVKQNSKIKDFTINPNPITSESIISYKLTEKSTVKLIITNLLGVPIDCLVNEIQPLGVYSYLVPNFKKEEKQNLFFVTLWINGNPITKKLLVIE